MLHLPIKEHVNPSAYVIKANFETKMYVEVESVLLERLTCRFFLKADNSEVIENESVWMHLTLEMRIADI